MGGRGFSEASGRSAPLPRLPGGGPHFSREMGRKRAGAAPLDPQLYSPLAAARWFLGSLSLKRSRGYFLRDAKTDLGRIFEKKYAGKHFCERKFPNQGTYMDPEIDARPKQCATTAKTSEWERAGHKKGGPGGTPLGFFLPISSQEMGTPARGRAGTHVAGLDLHWS